MIITMIMIMIMIIIIMIMIMIIITDFTQRQHYKYILFSVLNNYKIQIIFKFRD